jgi:predicted RNase H-like HicB family nuclease
MRGRNCIHRSRREAIELHRQGLQEDGLPLPEPQAFAEYVAVL